jgi:glycosyltransferase involved in cell wall biosynthesis
MNVLIGDFDLYNSVGGGQTVYRRLIETNSHLNFHYFIDKENEHASRPVNAFPIRYQKVYNNLHLRKHINDIEPSIFSDYDFSVISNMAYSVADRSFDVFDSPDYYRFGYFIRPAMKTHNVKIGKIVLAMHGNLSTTNYLNWHGYHVHRYDHELCEQWQYRSVDVRYGISKDYLEEWFGLVPIQGHYLNPNKFFDFPEVQYISSPAVKPDLNFIGRTEKRKGPDIFCEIAAAIPRHLYNQANIIGPDDGMGSNQYVEQYIAARSYDMHMVGSRTYAQLQQIFVRPSITILPSRYDTLNLVALESLLSGCPTAVSNQAGVTRFLKEKFPNVPFIQIHTDRIQATASMLTMILENYDMYRTGLIEELKRTIFDKSGKELDSIYSATPEYIDSDFGLHSRWYNQFLEMHKGITLYKPRQVRITAEYWNLLNSNEMYAYYRNNSVNYYNAYIQIAKATEDTEKQINQKIESLWNFSDACKVDRVRVWNALSKLERMKGNHTLAASYQLRIMRSLGSDCFGTLPYVKEALIKEGFTNEAQVAELMFDGHVDQHARCLDYLDQSYQKNLITCEFDYQFIERHNHVRDAYKVTVIVSMYNAANKLKNFISRIQNQTIFIDHAAELIFV